MDTLLEQRPRSQDISPSANVRAETDTRGLGLLLDVLVPARRAEALRTLQERGLIDASTAPRWAAELARPIYRLPLVTDVLVGEKIRLDRDVESLGGQLTAGKTQEALRRLRQLLLVTGHAEALTLPAMEGRTVLDFGAGIYSTLSAAIVLHANGFERAIAYEPYAIEPAHVAASVAQTLRWLMFDPGAFCFSGVTPAQMKQRLFALDFDQLEARLSTFAQGDAALLELGGVVLARDLSTLPDHGVDLVFSNSVLEHVDDLDGELRGLHRLLQPHGLCVHTVDFSDHRAIGTGLHPFQMYHDGVLAGINGLRPSQVESQLWAGGFEGTRIEQLRLPAQRLADLPSLQPAFARFSEQELAVWVNSYVLRARPEEHA